MKKVIFLLVVFVTTSTMNAFSLPKKPIKNKKTELTIEDFKNDPLTIQLQQQVKIFFDALKNKESAMLFPTAFNGLTTRKSLNEKYSQEKVTSFIDELASDPTLGGNEITEYSPKDDGNKCKRNSDGSVNMKDCNAWEHIKAFFKTLTDCPAPDIKGYPAPTEKEINDFQDCAQGVICKTC